MLDIAQADSGRFAQPEATHMRHYDERGNDLLASQLSRTSLETQTWGVG